MSTAPKSQLSRALDALSDLFDYASDVCDPGMWEHRHLRASLLEAAAVLHKEKRMDDGDFAFVCQNLDPDEEEDEGDSEPIF